MLIAHLLQVEGAIHCGSEMRNVLNWQPDLPTIEIAAASSASSFSFYLFSAYCRLALQMHRFEKEEALEARRGCSQQGR